MPPDVVFAIVVIVVIFIIFFIMMFNKQTPPVETSEKVAERALNYHGRYNSIGHTRYAGYPYFNNWYSGYNYPGYNYANYNRWNYTPTFYYPLGYQSYWWNQPAQYLTNYAYQPNTCYDYLGNVIQCQYTYRDLDVDADISTNDAEVINIVIKRKDHTHKYYKQGEELAYVINGVQSPDLKLKRNKKYRFVVHGDKMYLNSNPASTGAQDKISSGPEPASQFDIIFDDKFPKSFYYDSAHKQYMGGRIDLE
jgi:hypothetical protein